MSDEALKYIREAKEQQLIELDLSALSLTEIPEDIRELTTLRVLRLEQNEISNIGLLENLTNLTELILYDNQISDIKPLEKLANLTFIDLDSNWVSDLKPLENLTSLVRLYLSNNQISDISPLENLTNLNELNLDSNLISDITPLEKLTNLIYIDLDSNLISDIKPLEKLPGLTNLFLNNNDISDISALGLLRHLTGLYLRNNNIFNIKPIGELTNLIYLVLEGNVISDVKPLEKLTKLNQLDLKDNQISDISGLINLLSDGIHVNWAEDYPGGMSLHGNPLTNPPIEIVEQGNEAVLRYFEELKKGTYIINEARVLIVGQGGAGKTSLRKKLKNPNAKMPDPGDTTKGIEIDVLDVQSNGKNYKLYLWDFGGQNIQHYAHQFFLTESSLYVLLNNEREQNANFQYWLNIIEMLGCKSPVMIVQNEIAGHSEPITSLAAIRGRFSNVLTRVHSVDVSNPAKDSKFEQLKNDIIYQALALPHVGKQYPSSYINVRDRLNAEIEQSRYFIPWSEYNKICEEEGVTDPELRRDIAITFSFLGTCLYFKDDIELRNFLFLNPKWIIDALFRLLYHEKIIAQKGQFSETDVLDIWAEPMYEGMHGKLLRIMENFELCYRIKDGRGQYIVPQRLPVAKESYEWDEDDYTRIEYRYKFMPKGIITRTICRLHEKIMGNNVSNDAVIFGDDKAKVFVREVYSEEKLAIEAAGPKRAELLNRVIDEIDDIHKKSRYENLQVEKLIPCPCDQCLKSQEPYFFDYDLLCKLLDAGEFYERCKKSLKMMDIRIVLKTTGIKFPEVTSSKEDFRRHRQPASEETPLKVFISYSHKDEKLKDQLDDHLSDLKRSNKIAIWNDRMLGGGTEWDDTIRAEIHEADIILLLVSASFMASKYVWETEIKLAIDRHNNKQAKVIPVILRKCDFKDMPFAKLQGYPKDAKPVASFRDKDAAFTQVAQGIRNDIENWKAK